MTSPNRRKDRVSPIRGLEEKSPYKSRKLRTILEEDTLEAKITPTISPSHNSILLEIENRLYRDRLRDLGEAQAKQYDALVQNVELRRENDILKEKYISNTSVEIQKLNKELNLALNENAILRNDLQILKSAHEKDIENYTIENESLKKQIETFQQKLFSEAKQIELKYNKYAEEDISVAKKAYVDDMSKVLQSLEKTKALLAQKQNQVISLTKLSQQMANQHNANMEYLISQNNTLRGKIDITQIKMNNEVKQAQNRKELQKSRTHGLMTYCLQSNAYMEKEIHKLAEELLEKNISIESFTKDILKMKKNLESTQKRYEHKLSRVEDEKEQKLLEAEKEKKKIEKFYKDEIAELNKKIMELQQIVLSRENEAQNMKRELEHEKHILEQKIHQNEELKANINRMHEDHANQISKVMSQSMVKRRSMKNLSELSSLRDLSAEGNNSQVKKSILRRDSIDPAQQGSSGQLYTVHEQIAKSHILPGGSEEDDEEDVGIKQLIFHYENVISDLKDNHAISLNLANDRITQLDRGLREKQQEVLQVLERFSPLMEYKLNQHSLEQERKQKIQKHMKSDISLLGVFLQKYKIVGVKPKN